MLYWPHDQTITDRICKEQFITSTLRGNAQQAIFLLEKDFTDFLGVLGLVVKRYHFQFGQEQKAASNQYQALVRSGIKAESPLKAIKGRLFR
jgi:hypothetical protein